MQRGWRMQRPCRALLWATITAEVEHEAWTTRLGCSERLISFRARWSTSVECKSSSCYERHWTETKLTALTLENDDERSRHTPVLAATKSATDAEGHDQLPRIKKAFQNCEIKDNCLVQIFCAVLKLVKTLADDEELLFGVCKIGPFCLSRSRAFVTQYTSRRRKTLHRSARRLKPVIVSLLGRWRRLQRPVCHEPCRWSSRVACQCQTFNTQIYRLAFCFWTSRSCGNESC